MRLFLIDAHPVFREGLKSLLSATREMTVVGEADTCQGLAQQTNWDCDLLVMDGELDCLSLLQPKGRPPFTLVLTRHTEDQHALQMLTAGADGYLHKNTPASLVLDVMRKVSRGGKYVSRELAETVLLNFDRMSRPARLSRREYQVLYLFASGLAMKEIAGQLSLSIKTVSTYRCRLLEKLNLTSNSHLMRYALKEGVMN
jgi:DNA-binding NarL/FixJ family response regulator